MDRIFARPAQVENLLSAAPVQLALESPHASSASIQSVVWAEYFVGELGEVTRASALQIPAVRKARSIVIPALAGAQLREYEGDRETTPNWLLNSKSGISPWHRTAAVVDDLFFYDWSALAVERDRSGQIVDAVRVPYERWSIDAGTGQVRVDNKVVSKEQIVLIPGSGDGGLLACGAPTIKGYRALERAWIGRAQNPIPAIEIHKTDDDPLTDGTAEDEDNEVQALIDSWAVARTSPTGAVGFTPHNIEIRVHGTVSADLYEQGRNAAVLDIARLTGVPASLLDGSQSTASLTYVTSEGKRSEFDALSLPQWTNPIEARLSLDDVSAPGRVIRFDMSARVSADAPALREPLDD